MLKTQNKSLSNALLWFKCINFMEDASLMFTVISFGMGASADFLLGDDEETGEEEQKSRPSIGERLSFFITPRLVLPIQEPDEEEDLLNWELLQCSKDRLF